MEAEQLQETLARCRSLPSPPGIAMQVVALAQDPDAGVSEVADLVQKDPALAARILRAANSPLYARNREITNVRQALMLLGLHATLSLALGFSLVAGLKEDGDSRIDYPAFWRHAVLSAMISRMLAEHLRLDRAEDVFLMALLQDIGVLALDRTFPDYGGLYRAASDHQDLVRRERERYGADHAAAGSWLLCKWGLPEFICQSVALSHDPAGCPEMDAERRRAIECVAASGPIAEIFLLSDDRQAKIRAAAEIARSRLGVEAQAFSGLVEAVCGEWPDIKRLYELPDGADFDPTAVMDEAREVLLVRNLHALQEANEYRNRAESLEKRNQALEQETRTDVLTGLYNRAYFDEKIEEEFSAAQEHGWPLSLAFLDLDHFKRINDTFGHQVGDQVLRSVAGVFLKVLRKTDIPCRYGGEEFVVIVPGYNAEQALIACERVRRAVAEATHAWVDGKPVGCTLSVGLAAHNGGARFDSPEDLIRAADRAVYAAKLGGRNRTMLYHASDSDRAATA